MEQHVILAILAVTAFLGLVGYIAAGQSQINSRMDKMQGDSTSDRVRIDRIERDVHEIREENKALSDAYMRLATDVHKAVKDAMGDANERLRRIEDYLIRGAGKE